MRVRRKESVVLPERVGAVARPGIPARVRDESCAHRVLLDVTHGGEEVAPRLHRRRVVSFLPQRVVVPVGGAQVTRVTSGERGHQPRSAVRVDGREEQVHMIAHQRVSVDRALGPRRAFAQRFEVGGAVSCAGKAGAAFASALHDVQCGVGFFGTGKARHARNNAAGRGGVDPALKG